MIYRDSIVYRAISAAVFCALLYFASFGPAFGLAFRWNLRFRLLSAYEPVIWLSKQTPRLAQMRDRYIALWGKPRCGNIEW
jgi:hypothetical protein